ncbi:uncharacterized protein LOC143024551 [Oratosquilla oratoria]|uniref:uncharacterized protein LOC143024551 n=1 Tax=Oratosquilla oratoria TaxID=337810 RepID=UPI003F76DCCE
MQATILCNGDMTDPIEVCTGVTHGCVIAPTLFSLFLAAILHIIENDLPLGVQLTCRTDGKLFNINHLKATMKTTTTSVEELQYADDTSVNSCTEEDLQTIVNAFTRAYNRLGLKLNASKTKVLYQPSPNTTPSPSSLTANGVLLENVDCFSYFGSFLSQTANIDAEVQHCISSASVAFGRLRQRVFDDHNIRKTTKIAVYKAVVIPTLLYGAETWVPYARHIKALEKFHQRCLRRPLGISWHDRRTNTSVLKEAHSQSIEAAITHHMLRWAGHVNRMSDDRLPKQVLYAQITHGKRSRGGQRKRYKYVIKRCLDYWNINTGSWEEASRDCSKCRTTIANGVQRLETRRTAKLEEKRTRRKERLEQRGTTNQPYTHHLNYPHCHRVCRSRIGLISHLRTHQS